MDTLNYITIQGWMRTELNLKGNELLVYAIIYGFSQTPNQKFTGNLQYLADWCGATKQGISNNLKNLIEKQLIVKEEQYINGVKFVAYYTTKFNTPQNSLINNILLSKDNNDKVLSKDNTTNFFKSVKPEKKKSMYDKCVALIDSFTNDSILREMLIKFLQICLSNASDADRPFYTNNFKGKLNQLVNLSDDNYIQREIVKCSIDNGWSGFYEIKNNRNASAKSVNYTNDELDELAEIEEKRREQGLRTEF